jgi:hypothetical protein
MEVNQAGCEALGAIVERIKQREETAFLYISNRFEGSAPEHEQGCRQRPGLTA